MTIISANKSNLSLSLAAALATTMHNMRKHECIKTNYSQFLKLSKCSQNNQQTIHTIMANVSDQLTFVMNSGQSAQELDSRLEKICCLVKQTEVNLLHHLEPVCQREAKVVVRLYKLLLNDVVQLVCQGISNDRCKLAFASYKPPARVAQVNGLPATSNKLDENLIVTRILAVVFSLVQ